MSGIDSFYAVLKVAEVCNLDCPYCYFFHGGDSTFEKNPKYVSPATVRAAGRFLAEGMRDYGVLEVGISLHGGEPLMLGKRRFIELCRILHEEISPHGELHLSMQTNGTLIDEEWIDILSAYEIGVGVSLDGPAYINDVFRVDKKGRGSHADVVRGLRKLADAKRRGLMRSPAVNCVINPDHEASEIFRHFTEDLKLDYFDFAPPIMDWATYDETIAARISKFFAELLDLWIERGDPGLGIGAFSDLLPALLTEEGMDRRVRNLSNNVPTFTIRSDGMLAPDDALAPKLEMYRDTKHNVASSSLRDFLEAPLWNEIAATHKLPDGECQQCKWANLCGGGLAEHRYKPAEGFRNRTTYCESRKRIYEGLYNYVSPVLGPDVVDARLARRASQPTEMQAAAE
jgi:uncharacterized protein